LSQKVNRGPWGEAFGSESSKSTKADAAGFVLAGGQSSRMGSDKALLDFGGRPLVEQAIGILKAAGLPVCIAGASEETRALLENYAPVIPDAEPGLGPLAGVCSALRSTTADYAVFLPVDIPLMPPSLLLYLLRHAWVTGSAVTLASVNASAQTFPVVIARQAHLFLERKLSRGELGCLAAFRAAAAELEQPIEVLPVEVLVQVGQVGHPQALPAVCWFLNVNRPGDLRRALSLRTGRVS
jgi:molybdopterin-guanine dinucleotide biosynthesis protein A